jgi:hypothetical protein
MGGNDRTLARDTASGSGARKAGRVADSLNLKPPAFLLLDASRQNVTPHTVAG